MFKYSLKSVEIKTLEDVNLEYSFEVNSVLRSNSVLTLLAERSIKIKTLLNKPAIAV
jgi:hypothetical protein